MQKQREILQREIDIAKWRIRKSVEAAMNEVLNESNVEGHRKDIALEMDNLRYYTAKLYEMMIEADE